MAKISPIYTSIHTLDPNRDNPESQVIDDTATVVEYVESLVLSLEESKVSRRFQYTSETVQVKKEMETIISNSEESASSDEIARRLHRTEKDTQERVKMTELQKGSLLICHFKSEDDSTRRVLLAKIDHSEFLGLDEFKKRIGLPFQKQVLKAATGKVSSDGKLKDMILADSNGKIAVFWWKAFLELDPIFTDEQNTTAAFNALDRAIAPLKRKSEADHTRVRNRMMEYFLTSEDFSFSDLTDHLTGNYHPSDPSFTVGLIQKAVEKLKDSEKFDSTFGVDLEKVRSRVKFKKFIPLADEIELRLQPNFDWGNKIEQFGTTPGSRGIKIVSEVGYSVFSKNRQPATDSLTSESQEEEIHITQEN